LPSAVSVVRVSSAARMALRMAGHVILEFLAPNCVSDVSRNCADV
jgi:hypothetical protein